ncbi:MAG: CotH kinase family protein [Bacteroidales bacterium]|nr:CotH kinase family protein [Bacteroidales bacterium]
MEVICPRIIVRKLTSGTLINWSLTFGSDATGPDATFTSSELPIVMLNTNGQFIPNEPKIPAGLKIINNGPGIRNYITDPPQFEGYSGVERRGSTALYWPKKSYGLETWDALGNDIDTTLLGMPSEEDWILNAGFPDKSLIRNVMAYQLWQNLGHYATRYQFVELVINGQYKGVYIFSEKIKRNKNRVKIAKLDPDDNAGDSLTGGYIIKIDKSSGSGGFGWTSQYWPTAHPWGQTIYFQYEYPDEIAITSQQKLYLMDYVDDFETALHGPNFADTALGFRKYAIESTFIDYFLVNEISKNVDAYRCSTFLHKQRDSKGDKIRMGPVWDYDLAWHNANFCGGDVTTGWAYQFPCPQDPWQVPFWWSKLLTDTLYASHLKCRWQYLRQNILSNDWFDNYIDSTAAQLDESQQRNFATWPVLGIYLWPNPWPFPTTYQGEINNLKNWLHNRLAWLDANMPGTCYTTALENVNNAVGVMKIYPNPATSRISVETPITGSLSIMNLGGQVMFQQEIIAERTTIEIGSLPVGIYIVKVVGECSVLVAKFTRQ